mgnify:CR=1 FL=1
MHGPSDHPTAVADHVHHPTNAQDEVALTGCAASYSGVLRWQTMVRAMARSASQGQAAQVRARQRKAGPGSVRQGQAAPGSARRINTHIKGRTEERNQDSEHGESGIHHAHR